jgi:oligopeptide/dipeptide ABC transporter ATP-binding protein
MLGFFIFVAIFPSELSPYNPTSMSFAPGLGPSGANWLGTTTQGQDILSELIWGARQTLIIAFAAGGLATIVSVIVGVSAAYMGGLVDGVLSLITDVLLVIPIFPLVIVIAAYLRSVGLLVMIIVLGALGWSYGARQLRVQVLSLRRRDFLGAARVRGERSGYIIVAEIIPTMTSLIVASFLGTAVFAVLTAAGLQFLGLGDPNSQSWGNMLYWAQNNEALEAGNPLWAIVPGACIALLGAAFAFLNYAFDEVSNPALRPVRKLSRRSVRRAKRASGMTGTSASQTSSRQGGPSQAGPGEASLVEASSNGFSDGGRAGSHLLEVRHLSVAYATDAGPVLAVKDVDLDLDGGEFLAIVGESGCGKSTLLYAIAQLLNPPAGITGGSVNFSGREMAMMSDKKMRRIRWSELSVVMQSAMNALNPVMTLGEQMRDACKTHAAMSNKQIAERSAEVLRLVSIDPVHLSSYPHQLSGGMRQRAMIAMALLFTPQLVIMDEPTSALDVVAQRSLMRQIKDLQQELGFAVIFVTHDISLVRHYSDRLLVMYAGQVAELGATAEVIGTPRHPYSSALLEAFPSVRGEKVTLTGIAGSPPNLASPPSGCRFHPRCADAMSECSAEEPPLYMRGSSMVRCLLYRDGAGALESLAGRSVRRLDQTAVVGPITSRAAAPPPTEPNGEEAPLLEVSGLTLQFNLGAWWSKKMLHAVDDVSFTIARREIVALVGESGSGKSTIARLLAMVYKPTSGEIRFEGNPLSTIQGRQEKLAYSGDVPMVFQDPFSSFNPAYRVSHGIMRAIELHRPEIAGAARRDEALQVMDAVELQPADVMLSRYPYELSGGQRQRVGFAQALALRPKLILADEPVSMLDVSIRVGILNMMARLREREGVSILYITHDLASARYVADRVIVMYAGHVVEIGPTEQLLASPRHPYTQLLLSAVPDPRAPLGETSSSDVGEPPKVVNPAPGCRFEPRCPFAIEQCRHVTPVLGEVAPGQLAACHVALAEARDLASAARPLSAAPSVSAAPSTTGERSS